MAPLWVYQIVESVLGVAHEKCRYFPALCIVWSVEMRPGCWCRHLWSLGWYRVRTWGLPSLLPATIDILVFSIQRAQHSSGHRSQFVLEDDSDIRVRSAEGRSGNLRKITFNFFIKTTFTVHNWTVSASADWGGKDIKLLRLLFSCLQLPPL